MCLLLCGRGQGEGVGEEGKQAMGRNKGYRGWRELSDTHRRIGPEDSNSELLGERMRRVEPWEVWQRQHWWDGGPRHHVGQLEHCHHHYHPQNRKSIPSTKWSVSFLLYGKILFKYVSTWKKVDMQRMDGFCSMYSTVWLLHGWYHLKLL